MDGAGVNERSQTHDDIAPDHSMANWKKRVNTAAILGWTISLAIHVIAIIGIGRIGWIYGNSSPDPDTEVAIVEFGDTESLGKVGEEAQLEQSFAVQPEVEMPESEVELDALMPAESTDTLQQQVLSSASFDVEAGTAGFSNTWDQAAFAGGGAAGSGGASFFGLEVSGTRFVYVVDRSGSMSGRPLAMAKAELQRSIREMDAYAEFFVIFYNESHTPMSGGSLREASNANKQDCFRWLETISAGGGTDPTSAMQMAIELDPDAIWLLSDGQFNETIADNITGFNRQQSIAINTIAFISRAGEEVLKKIASQNEGKYRFVPAP